MSIAFATKLSSLRREKQISQKTAADELGISQALLSHYEKGIRECNLDFLVKAANYYNVSTDYLLGKTETKNSSNSELEEIELESDSQIKDVTILRSILYLKNESEKDININNFFVDFFTLSIKKYLSIVNDNNYDILPIIDSVQNSMKSASLSTINSLPAHIETLNSHSYKIIADRINSILK